MPLGLVPYGGSSWISFTKEAVEYIREFARANTGLKVIEFFRTVLHPEEMLFQTILMNSELAKHVHGCNYRYIDWSVEPKHPAVLNLDDYERIVSSGAFIARKFDETVSSEIMDALDRTSSALHA